MQNIPCCSCQNNSIGRYLRKPFHLIIRIWQALKTHSFGGGLSILKYLENLSDEVLVQRWVQNPYYQAFTGEIEFQWKLPNELNQV